MRVSTHTFAPFRTAQWWQNLQMEKWSKVTVVSSLILTDQFDFWWNWDSQRKVVKVILVNVKCLFTGFYLGRLVRSNETRNMIVKTGPVRIMILTAKWFKLTST